MNINDYRFKAYSNAANASSGDGAGNVGDNNAPNLENKTIKKPVFEKVNRQVGDILERKPMKPSRDAPLKAFNDALEEMLNGTGKGTGKNAAGGNVFKKPATPVEKKAIDEGGLLRETLREPSGNFGPSTGSGTSLRVQQPTPEKDSVYRRIAKFLILIGEDAASLVLKQLPQDQIEKIVAELATIRNVDQGEAALILEEFQNLVEKKQVGGFETAKEILQKVYGSVKAERIIEKVAPFGFGKPFDYLKGVNGEKIKRLLKDESGQVRSMVLSFLEPKVAADYINALEADEKKDLILRLAKIKELNPDIVRRVDMAMSEKLEAMKKQEADLGQTIMLDGRGALAAILKKMDKSAEEKILSGLSADDEELGESLKKMLFTMEDVLSSDDRFIQNMLRKMEDKEIATLIAGKGDDFRLKILKNVSAGRGDEILQEESLMMPIRKVDSDKVTNDFFAKLRAAYEDGRLIVRNRNEEYV